MTTVGPDAERDGPAAGAPSLQSRSVAALRSAYMVAGEAAERVLLAAVTEAAAAAGVARVKLRSPYQVGGGREFYAQCGFAPCPDCTPGGGGESCEWLQHDCAA